MKSSNQCSLCRRGEIKMVVEDSISLYVIVSAKLFIKKICIILVGNKRQCQVFS